MVCARKRMGWHVLIAAALAVTLAPGPPARAAATKKKKTTGKTVADFGIPKGSVPTVTLGYHHHLENNSGSKSDTNATYASPGLPAPGTSSTTTQSKTTSYDGGRCDSDWSVTIDNLKTDAKHILINVDKLISAAQAPKPDRDSSAVSKERVSVSGNIAWSPGAAGEDEKVIKKKKKAAKKSAVKKKSKKKAKKKSKKKAKKSLIDDLKQNGFLGAHALALVDAYADIPGASWDISEDYLAIESIEMGNHTFGALAGDNSQTFVDLDEYAGVIRLEADPDFGHAQIDSFFDVMMSGTLTPVPDGIGSAALVEGSFAASGCFDITGWTFEGAPGAYTSATLPIDLLPEIGWEIKKTDLPDMGDPEFWSLPRALTLHVEDAAYAYAEAVPEPGGLALIGAALLARRRRRP